MKIAVIGANGRLGRGLVRMWQSRHEVVAVTRERLDLNDLAAVDRFVMDFDGDAIVNAAALSGLEDCFERPWEAHRINAQVPERLAAHAHRRGIRFLHYSTDYVLDGRRAGLKNETSKVKPINVYGESKAEGEARILAASDSAGVMRVSWIFGPDLPSFPHQILHRAMQGLEQNAIADKYSLPTETGEIARCSEQWLVEGWSAGIYHCCNAGEAVSWHAIGRETLRLAERLGYPIKCAEIRPTTLRDAHFFKDARPIHTAMACEKIEALRGRTLTPWQDALAEHLMRDREQILKWAPNR